MNAYRSLFVARFSLLLQYRAAALAGIGTQFFWGLLKVMVLEAFFQQSTTAQPITFQETLGYIWLGQAFLFAIVPWSGDREIQELIRSGAVGYDLLRPTDLYNFWLTRALAMRTAPIVLRALPLLILTMVLFPQIGLAEWALAPPPSVASLGAFLLTFMGAILLSAALTMLLTVSMMWTLSGEGLNQMAPTLVTILSGMIVPLPLFPDWFKPILAILPFSGLLDKPFRLFTGNLPPEALLNVLLHQTVWIVVLIGLGRFLVSRGVNRLIIQGG
ncbi:MULTISPECIES: ABC transporter permease [Leptolyngbya]|uniref:ABC transporter permease n=1 Tax=Leptolyngbya TaxID=47251 RepID=UPI001688F714|nr:ABC-2 family transporter protein [Leptolyngbya sp. FACHB-1624]MBD1855822.1 ABC-2 family transporter protein [Leptolyngbya sp. FACHB-1624]